MQSSVERRAWSVFAGIVLAAVAAAVAWYVAPWAGNVTYELRTHDPVSGLIAGAPVEFHGVEVGQVRDVRLLDPRTVQVLLRVRSDAPVSTATVATITGRGLAARGFTGYVYISLEDIAPAGAALRPAPGDAHAVIATAPARSVSLDASVEELNDNMRAVTALLQGVLDPQTAASLKATLAHVEAVSGSLAANDARLRAIIANAERTSGQLSPLLRSGTREMDTLQSRVLPQAQDTLSRFDAVAGSANGVMRHMDEASTGLVPLLRSGNAVMGSMETQLVPQARQGLSRMNQAIRKIDDAATRVREDPSVLIRGSAPAPHDPGEPD